MNAEEETFHGPYAVQLQELSKTLNSIEQLAQSTIAKYSRPEPIDDNEQKSLIAELDKQIEGLHLKDTAYFGECDHRKQQIETVISQRLDVKDFKEIAKAIEF